VTASYPCDAHTPALLCPFSGEEEDEETVLETNNASSRYANKNNDAIEQENKQSIYLVEIHDVPRRQK